MMPMNRPPVNALAQGIASPLQQQMPPNQLAPQRPEAPPDPFEAILDAARRSGVDVNRATAEDILDAAWKSQPSDGMGEAIDQASRHFGIKPPWERQR